MARVLCVGIATLDHVYAVERLPIRAEKHRASGLVLVGGGIAANAAVAVARLGGEAAIATRLGDDAAARDILADLEREGVHCALARRFPGRRSCVSAVLVDGAGERIVVSYADPDLPTDPGWLPQTLLRGVGAVLGDTRWEEGAAHLFALARAAGIPAVLDADRRPVHPEAARLASHVAYSEQGLAEVTGLDDPHRALESLAVPGGPWLAVTMGGGGVVFTQDKVLAHEPAFKVTAVDTLAAGDVWHGAFALALAEGRREREAVRFACAAAAIKCTRFGGRAGAPRRAEVEDLVREPA